jgi:hypothetical protein
MYQRRVSGSGSIAGTFHLSDRSSALESRPQSLRHSFGNCCGKSRIDSAAKNSFDSINNSEIKMDICKRLSRN